MVRTQVLKHLSGARKGKKRGSKGDVRRGVTARGDRRRRVGVSGSLRGRRLEEMTQSNTLIERFDRSFVLSSETSTAVQKV